MQCIVRVCCRERGDPAQTLRKVLEDLSQIVPTDNLVCVVRLISLVRVHLELVSLVDDHQLHLVEADVLFVKDFK